MEHYSPQTWLEQDGGGEKGFFVLFLKKYAALGIKQPNGGKKK